MCRITNTMASPESVSASMREYTQTRSVAAARKQDERVQWSAVVSPAPKKHLFLNVRRKRLLVSLFGKNSCDINERLTSF